MLTNTVGIMLFILAFTVLAAGGVVIAKRLPMEQITDDKPVEIVCFGNRILPLDGELVSRFRSPLGRPSGYDDIPRWLQKYNSWRIEDDYYTVRGDGKVSYSGNFGSRTAHLHLTVKLTRTLGKGERNSSAAFAIWAGVDPMWAANIST